MSKTEGAQRQHVSLWLFLFLVAVYLLNYRGAIHSADEISMLVVGKSLLKQHSFDASAQIWAYQTDLPTPQESFGSDRQLYSKKGPGQPLLLAALMAISAGAPISPVHIAFLLNPLGVALTAVVGFITVQFLGGAQSTALWTALLFGLATPALPYAKYLFNEPLTGLLVAAALCAMLGWQRGNGRGPLALAAFCLAAAAWVRQEAVLLYLPFGVYWLFAWRSHPRRRVSDWLLFGAPLLLGTLALVAYNLVTSGAVIPTLYDVNSEAESFSTPLGEGLYGLFLSPGKGLFVYAPVLLLMLPGVIRLWMRERRVAWLVLGVIALYASLHALFHDWWGGTAWGPRPLVPLLPLFAIFAAFGIEPLLRSRAGTLLLVGLSALSVAVQVLGTTANFLDYARILSQIRPDAEWTIGVYSLLDSPILGHMRLIAQAVPDFAWVVNAELDWTIDWALLAPLTILWVGIGIALGRSASGKWLASRWLVASSVALLLGMGWLLARIGAQPVVEDAQAWRAVSYLLLAHAAANDVLLNTAPSGRIGLLYFDKSPARWFNFVEEPAPLQARTESYLTRHVAAGERVWLTAWKTRETNPNLGFDGWLAARYYQVAQWEFGKPARLLLFERARAPSVEESNIPLGGIITLRRAQVEQRIVGAGNPVCVRLTWQVNQPTREPIVEFVHLMDSAGRVRAQVDRAPVNGFRPSESWRAGEVLDDYVVVPSSAELEAGDYQLVAGMYRQPWLERLSVPNSADNLIHLGTIQLTRTAPAALPSCHARG